MVQLSGTRTETAIIGSQYSRCHRDCVAPTCCTLLLLAKLKPRVKPRPWCSRWQLLGATKWANCTGCKPWLYVVHRRGISVRVEQLPDSLRYSRWTMMTKVSCLSSNDKVVIMSCLSSNDIAGLTKCKRFVGIGVHGNSR